MNDAATVFGKPKALTVGDRTYQLHPLDFDDHGDVQKWLDDQIRDPLEIVRKSVEDGAAAGLPIEIQKYMIKAAIEVAARTRILVGTQEADQLLGAIEGKAQLLYLSIRKGDKDFTFEKAMGLMRQMDHIARAKAAAAADVLRSDEDPKAPGGDGTTGGGGPTTPPATPPSPSTGGT